MFILIRILVYYLIAKGSKVSCNKAAKILLIISAAQNFKLIKYNTQKCILLDQISLSYKKTDPSIPFSEFNELWICIV